jgi:AraC-like DNA-binding protein
MGGERSSVDPLTRATFAASDPDRARSIVTRFYADNQFCLDGPDETFDFQLATATAGPLSYNVARYGFRGRVRMAPVPRLNTMLALSGSLSFRRADRPDHTVTAGGVFLGDIEQPLDCRFADGVYATLGLPMSVIDQAAGASAGSDAAAVRFLDSVPVDDAAQRYWAQLMRVVQQQAAAADSPLTNPLVLDHLVHTLAGAALITFPNTVLTTGYLAASAASGPASLRRAVDYLHAHAAESITVAQIAASAGISTRALQQAFRRHHGYTPMAYLRRLRLERAHRDLQAADPTSGDTVTAIAGRWGFWHLSKFGAAYRARYGASPATTLRS